MRKSELKNILEINDIGRKALAQKAKISESLSNKMVASGYIPGPEIQKNVCAVLGCRPEDVFDGKGKRGKNLK